MNEYFCVWARIQNLYPDIFEISKLQNISRSSYSKLKLHWDSEFIYMYVNTGICTYICLPYRRFRPLNAPPISLHTTKVFETRCFQIVSLSISFSDHCFGPFNAPPISLHTTKGFEIRYFQIVYFYIKRLLQIIKTISWVL